MDVVSILLQHVMLEFLPFNLYRSDCEMASFSSLRTWPYEAGCHAQFLSLHRFRTRRQCGAQDLFTFFSFMELVGVPLLWNLLAFLPFFLSFYRTCSPHVLVFSRSANQSNIRSKSEARYRSVSTDLVPSQQARKEGGLVIEVYHLLTVCVPMSLWWPTSRVAV